jgi:hypothetical protein
LFSFFHFFFSFVSSPWWCNKMVFKVQSQLLLPLKQMKTR